MSGWEQVNSRGREKEKMENPSLWIRGIRQNSPSNPRKTSWFQEERREGQSDKKNGLGKNRRSRNHYVSHIHGKKRETREKTQKGSDRWKSNHPN